jgi:ATP-binding cassette, subfamily B (MDR/TAP), member 1
MQQTDDQSLNSKNYNNEKREAKSISFFKLQYTFTKRMDIPILILATCASFVLGISMPLFSMTYGDIINNFGDASVLNPEIFIEQIRKMCLQFLYIGLAMWVAGFLMIWLWSYNGRMIAKSIKEEYFKLLMHQEQGFFEVNPNILVFPTKIQSQIKKIEIGVIFSINIKFS